MSRSMMIAVAASLTLAGCGGEAADKRQRVGSRGEERGRRRRTTECCRRLRRGRQGGDGGDPRAGGHRNLARAMASQSDGATAVTSECSYQLAGWRFGHPDAALVADRRHMKDRST